MMNHYLSFHPCHSHKIAHAFHIIFLLILTVRFDVVNAQCETNQLLGAVLGTFFATFLAVIIIICIVYYCCLRERLKQASSTDLEASGAIPLQDSTLLVNGGDKESTDQEIECNILSTHNFPENFQQFLQEKEIHTKDVSALKFLSQDEDIGFRFSKLNDFIVVTELSENVSLPHLHSLKPGNLVLGVSMAFEKISVENFTTLMNLCCQNSSLLYIQKQSNVETDVPEEVMPEEKPVFIESVELSLKEEDGEDVIDRTDVKLLNSSFPSIPEVPEELRLATPPPDFPDVSDTSSISSHSSMPLPFNEDSDSDDSGDATPRASPSLHIEFQKTPTPHLLDTAVLPDSHLFIENGGTDSPTSSKATLQILDTGDDPSYPIQPSVTTADDDDDDEDSEGRNTPTPTTNEPYDDGKFHYADGKTIAMPILLVRNGKILSDPDKGTTMDVQMRTIKTLPSNRSFRESDKFNSFRKDSLSSNSTVMLDSDNEYIDVQVADEDIVRDPTIQVVPLYNGKPPRRYPSRSSSVSTTSTEAFEQEYQMYPIDM
jgi:hypothetical protein